MSKKETNVFSDTTNIAILLQTACTPAVVKHLAIQEPASTKPAAERASAAAVISGTDASQPLRARSPERRLRAAWRVLVLGS